MGFAFVPTFLAIIDLVILNDIDNLGPFQQKHLGYVKLNASIGFAAPLVIFLNCALMIGIHFRVSRLLIELLNK